MEEMRSRTENALRKSGGLFDFEDILSAIEDGSMQSFAEGDTWIVTQISNYPRKRALEIVLAVGDLEDVVRAEARIAEFARENSCEILMATGRVGWEGHMTLGWRKSASIYVKEL